MFQHSSEDGSGELHNVEDQLPLWGINLNEKQILTTQGLTVPKIQLFK
jgi:hypothetical protein